MSDYVGPKAKTEPPLPLYRTAADERIATLESQLTAERERVRVLWDLVEDGYMEGWLDSFNNQSNTGPDMDWDWSETKKELQTTAQKVIHG